MKKYYSLVRNVHLYIGLFISPFVIIFAVSILVFNHPLFFSKIYPVKELPAQNLRLDSFPVRSSDLLTARAILTQLDMTGEIDYITKKDSSLSFPVRTPGMVSRVVVNKGTGMVSVKRSEQGIFRGTTYLHAMPGPHNVAIRGNSGFINTWRYLTDTLVYSILFLTISGIFMWYFLQSERKMGLFALATGILILIGLLLLTF